MNIHTRGVVFALAFAVSLPFCAVADAQGNYYLQLGSFYTKEEATEKWNSLKAANPAIFKGLRLHIAEVSLPPENNISYRTQAGPITSQAKADKLCGQIEDVSAECYVVESAATHEDVVAFVDKPAEAVAKSPATPASEAPKTSGYISGREPHFLDDGSAVAAPPPPVVASLPEPKPVPAPARGKVKKTKLAKKSSKSPKMLREPKDEIIADRQPKFLDDEPATVMAAPPIAESKPVQPAPPVAENTVTPPKKRPGFFARLFGADSSDEKPVSPPPAPVEQPKVEQAVVATPSRPVVANVEVAEAIRVPLDEQRKSQPPANDKPYSVSDLNQAAAEKGNFWAEIKYFHNDASAQAFYDNFRNQHSDVADGLRIQITHAVNSTHAKQEKLALRMGPFAKPEQVKALCNAAISAGYNCTNVKEIASLLPDNSTIAVQDSGQPVNPAVSDIKNLGVYWVQLGSYNSPDEAWEKWSDVSKSKAKIIGRYAGNVTAPDNSSADVPTYRLRTGPFASSTAADSFCARLSQAGENCLVVNEK